MCPIAKTAETGTPAGFETEADHIPVRAFRKNLGKVKRSNRVVVIGLHARRIGLFVPVKLGPWAMDAEVLAEARRVLRKVKTVGRYQDESKYPHS